jgi:hypothetical protein
MNARTIATLGTLALIAACKPAGGDDVALKNVSLEDAAKQAHAANKLQPGQWEAQTRIVSVEVPGAPKEVADALGKSVAAKTNTVSDCLTPEEAEKPAADMFAGSRAGECRYEKFSMAGGKMDSTMVCKNPGQAGEMRMTMAGDYTPAGYALDMTMVVPPSAALGGKGMTMRARTEGRRTGECTAPAAGGKAS